MMEDRREEKDDIKIENINKQIEKVDGKIQKDDKKLLMLIIVTKGNQAIF